MMKERVEKELGLKLGTLLSVVGLTPAPGKSQLYVASTDEGKIGVSFSLIRRPGQRIKIARMAHIRIDRIQTVLDQADLLSPCFNGTTFTVSENVDNLVRGPLLHPVELSETSLDALAVQLSDEILTSVWPIIRVLGSQTALRSNLVSPNAGAWVAGMPRRLQILFVDAVLRNGAEASRFKVDLQEFVRQPHASHHVAECEKLFRVAEEIASGLT